MGLIWKRAYKEEWERRHHTLIRDSSILVKWHHFVSMTYECSFQMLWWLHAAHSPDLIREWNALWENPMLQLLSRRAAQGMQKRMKRSALAWDEELRDKEKQLCYRSLLSHAALILELCIVSVLLIAAITIKSVLKPSCSIYILPFSWDCCPTIKQSLSTSVYSVKGDTING